MFQEIALTWSSIAFGRDGSASEKLDNGEAVDCSAQAAHGAGSGGAVRQYHRSPIISLELMSVHALKHVPAGPAIMVGKNKGSH